jgi:hypothetical protein
MPNDPSTLSGRGDIYVCASHFDCEWVQISGGRRPKGPPTIFSNVPKSCLKQCQTNSRRTCRSSSSVRSNYEAKVLLDTDKIENFQNFANKLVNKYPHYSVKVNAEKISMFKVNESGSRVLEYLSFREVKSPFGFLHLLKAERDGYEVPKKNFILQKNSLLNRWSQLDGILEAIRSYVVSSSDHLGKIMQEMDQMTDVHHLPNFQFLQSQLQMLLMPKNNFHYCKHVLILASELLCVSPAAYRLLRRSGAINLPNEQHIRNLMSCSYQDQNLPVVFNDLKPEQRLLNLLFDEVKLKSELCYTAGHVVGLATNNSELLATSAVTFEAVCHYGGPRFILRVYPVAKINMHQLQELLLDTVELVNKCGGKTVSLICDNCPLNQGVYKALGGPGAVSLPNGDQVFSFTITCTYLKTYETIGSQRPIRN